MWKDELKEFYKYLEDNSMISGNFGSESIINNFFDSKVSLKTELLKKLSILPEAIKKLAYETYDKNKEYETININLKNIELATYNIVESESIDGKKIFSNESKRKIETDIRLTKDKNYQEFNLKAETLKKEIDSQRIELEFLNNSFKSARAITLILGVE